MNVRQLLLGICAGTALAVGVFVAVRMSAPKEPEHAFVLPAPESLPEFSLLDHNNDPFTPASFVGQWDLVFFGFTHCPDICPATLQQLSVVKRQLQQDGHDIVPRIVLVSVDPERDTPDSLRKYVSHFGPDNIGVTGAIEEIRKLAGGLFVYFEKVPVEGGEYTVDHSAAVLLIDPNGRYAAGFGGAQSNDAYITDLPILMSAQ